MLSAKESGGVRSLRTPRPVIISALSGMPAATVGNLKKPMSA
jgi:hypothetical protein